MARKVSYTITDKGKKYLANMNPSTDHSPSGNDKPFDYKPTIKLPNGLTKHTIGIPSGTGSEDLRDCKLTILKCKNDGYCHGHIRGKVTKDVPTTHDSSDRELDRLVLHIQMNDLSFRDIRKAIKTAVLEGRIDEVDNQIEYYSFLPEDVGGLKNRKTRLEHLRTELEALKQSNLKGESE